MSSMKNDLEEIISDIANCNIEFGNRYEGHMVYKTITLYERGVSFTYRCRFVYPCDLSYVSYALQTEKYTVNDLIHRDDFQTILYKIEDHLGKSIDELI